MGNEHLTRQAELIPLEVLGVPITIIGAGAIGGWVTLSLAKMGCEKLTVFDFDSVSIENLNSQFYQYTDIGLPKVEALARQVHAFTGTLIEKINAPYESGSFNGVVIAAVDSMEVRARIFNEHKESAFTKRIIDPRMGAETALLYSYKPTSPGSYEKSLYTDENAEHERCTAKATIYTANLLAGMVVKTVKDILVGARPIKFMAWDIRKNDFQSFLAD